MGLSFRRHRYSFKMDATWVDQPETAKLSDSQFREAMRLMCELHRGVRKPVLWRSRKMLARLIPIWGKACAYCGLATEPFEVEHMIPISRGGPDKLSNMTIACPPCNQAKGTRTPDEYGVQPRAHLND